MDPNTPDYIQKVQAQRQKEAEAAASSKVANSQNQATSKVVDAIKSTAGQTEKALKNVSGSVQVTNLQDIAKTGDVAALTDAINKLNLTTFTKASSPGPVQNLDLSQLSATVEKLRTQMEKEGLEQLAVQLTTIVAVLKDAASSLSGAKVSVDSGLQKTIEGLNKQIAAIDFKPTVNVASPTVDATTTVDLSPVTNALADVKKAISAQKMPAATDMAPVIQGLSDVSSTIGALRFPVPNYVLPFRQLDSGTGAYKDVQVTLDSSGNVPTSSSGGGGGGAVTIADGADVTLGAKADAKSTATDTTPITAMSVLKQISASVQAPPSPTTVLNGKTTVTTAGTRVVLASSTACNQVIIRALETNTGLIYVGSVTVSATNGHRLSAGESVGLSIANLTTVNIDSAVNGEGVSYLGS